jgi:molybdopterin synthase catalytic subunit
MIRIQTEDFDPGQEIDGITRVRTDIGGIASFVGTVRDSDGDDGITAMTLEHYPGMTEKQLAALEDEARKRWSLLDCLIIHRVGRLVPGDRIVLVVTASSHRADALESCAFLIDWLKTKAPFWKKEENADGERWVEARAEDTDAANRWEIS